MAEAARMAEEHAETKMIKPVLLGEIEPKDDRALQKIGRKKQAKNAALLMEVPELNTALIDVYRDLDRTTRAAKDLARKIKTVQQQAKSATELWRAAELKVAAWEQNRPLQPLLSLPAPTAEVLPAPVPTHSDLARPNIAMVEASTVTYSIMTIEASTITDSIQMVDAFTTPESVTPNEIAASNPLPIQDSSALRPPPIVMEKTEAPSPRPTKQVATQTGPPLRDYRASRTTASGCHGSLKGISLQLDGRA